MEHCTGIQQLRVDPESRPSPMSAPDKNTQPMTVTPATRRPKREAPQ